MRNRYYLLIFIIQAIIFYLHPYAAGQSANKNSKFVYLTGYETGQWNSAPDAPFDVSTFTGSINKGLIVFGGIQNKQSAFLKNLSIGQWEIIADAPFSVNKCCGNNRFGPIITGGSDQKQVAYMRSYVANTWIKTAPAPFTIHDIAGNNEYGPIITGGANGRRIAYMRNYEENKWHIVADAPFHVQAISGDNHKGILINGGSNNQQVAYMRSYTNNKWQIISNTPFPAQDLAGTNEYGPVVVGSQPKSKVAYLNNYQENKWRVVTDAPVMAVEISGTNDQGIILASGSISVKRHQTISRKVRNKILKTAVVEFTERGDLGIQDAGAIVAEWMTTSLNKTGAFEVYERLSLSTLMEEHKLGMSGLMDEATIAEIGRIRGVEAIVSGSVIKFGDVISVTAKAIDVSTAKIIKSSDIKVSDINAISTQIDALAWELAKE